MSASDKKKLRREENMAAMTERQQTEMKEAKKLRLYTVIFVAAIVLMIAVVICTTVFKSGIIERNTTALTVNGEKVSSVELNYFYMDSVNNYMDTYGDYASMFGLDTTVPLDEQFQDEENDYTWADYFMDSAIDSAKSTYALYLDAQANGYTLPEDVTESINTSMENLKLYASLYGFSSANSYIEAMYGAGSNEATLRDYMTVQYTASNYYNDTLEALTYTDEDLRAAEAENYNKYSSFTYDYYSLSVSSFLTGGTTDEEGNTTYSDEEQAAAEENCKTSAETLAAAESLEELNLQISTMAESMELSATETTAVTDKLYSSVPSAIAEWMSEEGRQAGDIGVVENSYTSTDEDGNEVTTINGYYIVHFGSINDNISPLVNVRHILFQYEGGTTDEETGETTYSDEEKAAAKTEAEELLASFTAGEATEDAFATLANENSDDTGSNTTGGLYENVYPNQMVTAFNDWCFDEARQPGDTGIVETEYGYHVMYFVGKSDTTYRDYMITNELQSADISEWETNLIDNTELVENDLSKVNKNLTLSTSEE